MIMDIAAIERLGFEIALGAYLISSILFILYLSSKKRRLADMGFTLTAFGFAFQTLALITRWFYAGNPPWVNTYEVMSFFAWTIVGAYLALNVRTDYKSTGTLVAPLAYASLRLITAFKPGTPHPCTSERLAAYTRPHRRGILLRSLYRVRGKHSLFI